MILDNSGSMAGSSFKALQQGAIEVAEKVLSGDYFHNLTCLFFNNKINKLSFKSIEEFKEKIVQVVAGSNTDLKNVFQAIHTYCQRNDPEDLTVLILTDGEDTINQKSLVN